MVFTRLLKGVLSFFLVEFQSKLKRPDVIISPKCLLVSVGIAGSVISKGNRDFDLILFRQLMRLAEKCASLNKVILCCFDACCNSDTLQSMKQIDTPIGSTVFKKRDKSKSSRVIHSSHYEQRKIWGDSPILLINSLWKKRMFFKMQNAKNVEPAFLINSLWKKHMFFKMQYFWFYSLFRILLRKF